MVADPLVMRKKLGRDSSRSSLRSANRRMKNRCPCRKRSTSSSRPASEPAPRHRHPTPPAFFPIPPPSFSLRTSNFYGVPQNFGAMNFCLPLGQNTREQITTWIHWWLNGTKVRRNHLSSLSADRGAGGDHPEGNLQRPALAPTSWTTRTSVPRASPTK